MAIEERVLWRPVEAASALGISKSKLYAMAKAGEVAGAMHLGGSLRIHRPTLEAWLYERARSEAA